MSDRPLLEAMLRQFAGKAVTQFRKVIPAVGVGPCVALLSVALLRVTVRSVVEVLLDVTLSQSTDVLRQVVMSVPVVVGSNAPTDRHAPAAAWADRLSCGRSDSWQASTGPKRAVAPIPEIDEHATGKIFKQLGRLVGVAIPVGVNVEEATPDDDADPGQIAAAIRQRTTSEPCVLTAMLAGFRHVVTLVRVCPTARGVMSTRQVAKGRVRAKPLRVPSALQDAGICVRQFGVGLEVAPVVDVERVALALPGHNAENDKQSTILWPLTRFVTSVDRHKATDGEFLSAKGRESVQVLRPDTKPRPVSLDNAEQVAGRALMQMLVGLDIVVDVLVAVDTELNAWPGQSSAASRHWSMSEPMVLN
jgi:hypothetical protein